MEDKTSLFFHFLMIFHNLMRCAPTLVLEGASLVRFSTLFPSADKLLGISNDTDPKSIAFKASMFRSCKRSKTSSF